MELENTNQSTEAVPYITVFGGGVAGIFDFWGVSKNSFRIFDQKSVVEELSEPKNTSPTHQASPRQDMHHVPLQYLQCPRRRLVGFLGRSGPQV